MTWPTTTSWRRRDTMKLTRPLMWAVLAELVQVLRESLANWPRTIRLLLVIAVVAAAVALLR